MKTVLIPPIVDWGFLKQLPQQIAEQFAKNGYKVYYIDVTITKGIKEVLPNLFVYGDYRDCLDDIKYKKLKVDIFYNSWAKNEEWIERVRPKVAIYHSCDSFSQWKPYERKMLDKSDIVLCTSDFLYKQRKHQHNNVHLVRNATCSSLLNDQYEPIEELKYIPSPTFAFIGATGEWVNTYLMKKVAEKYSTVFIGKEFGKKCPDNVINVGTKPHDKLINWYNSVDAFLLPFNTNSEITQAACPIKLYEYLSAGKPIISTSWVETELFNQDEEIIFTAKNNEEFLKQVDRVANLTQDELNIIKLKYKKIASENTWENRFEQIQKSIDDFCKNKGIII